jgi:RNAse (barnase) inhibitor barstar
MTLLKFPTWYGKNLDALNDLLTDLPDEARIVVKISRKEWGGIKGSYSLESSFKLATKGSGGTGYGQGKILLFERK